MPRKIQAQRCKTDQRDGITCSIANTSNSCSESAAERIVTDGEVTALDGSTVNVRVDSLCVHGDTVGAVQLAHAVRHALTRAGVRIAAFA